MTRRLTRLKVAWAVQVIFDRQSTRATFAVSQRVISPFGSRRSTGHENLTKTQHGSKSCQSAKEKHNTVRSRESLSNEIILIQEAIAKPSLEWAHFREMREMWRFAAHSSLCSSWNGTHGKVLQLPHNCGQTCSLMAKSENAPKIEDRREPSPKANREAALKRVREEDGWPHVTRQRILLLFRAVS